MSVSQPSSVQQSTGGPAVLEEVPGWFYNVDRVLFVWLLERQARLGTSGNLIEIGAYLGRSAILIADHLRPGESFTVCDLFDSAAPDEANSTEMDTSYRSTLTREAFERNYLAFHQELPDIVQAPSSVLADGRISARSARFIHIDASHLYEHVIGDIQFARQALTDEGIVVLDDYRSEHTPGVSAAVWEAVLAMGLKPVTVSNQKFYGTWGDPAPLQDALAADLAGHTGLTIHEERVRGLRLLRFRGGSGLNPPAFRPSRFYDPIAAEASARAAAEQKGGKRRTEAQSKPAPSLRTRASRLAVDLLPPMAVRAIRRARHR
ncbi:hypothetical protein ABH931_007027 [Streptacidiphilus sp. MAP12-33]|uniref:class I SAM-dependent methyltransferase n=1 Tax=Streptacidiphilus sp. MAP12-33 TaxID=3156266 RepID=UPI003511B98F